MGKYVHLTGSSASNLHSLEGQPLIKSVISKLCLKPNYPHTAELLDHMYNGLAVRAYRIYNYGRDHYTLGLPNGYGVYLQDTPLQDIEDAVEADVGYQITMNDSLLSAPDANIISKWYASENWGWNNIDNTFTNPPTSPIQGYELEMAQAEFDGEGVLRVIFYRGDPVSNEQGPEYVTIRVYDHGFDLEQLYYHVSYVPEGSSGIPDEYWFYQKGTGAHPPLDDEVETEFSSPFMPVIPLRVDNTSLGPECVDGEYVRDGNGDKIKPTTDLYKTSVQLCRRSDTNFDELTRELSNNPDIDEVDHAFLIFGVDIRTETKTGKHYLFQFFETMAFETSGASEIEVKDSMYRIKVKYSDITRTVHTGVLTEKTEIVYSGNDMTLSYQATPTEYTRVVVTDLLHINYVQDRHSVDTTLVDSASEDNYNFIIPLRFASIATDRSMLERENLMKESLKIVFNSYEKAKLKWYQQEWFKVVLIIVSIIVTALSFGTLAKAMIAAYSAFQALLIAAEAALYATLISVGFRLLARVLPFELLAILTIVVLAAGVLGAGGIDITSVTSETLLQLSSNLVVATQEAVQNDMADLIGEMEDFRDEAEGLEDELALMEETLAGEPLFNVQDILVRVPMFIEGETPNDFYTRTIHTGNIGTQSLNVIESYVDSQLKLPE